MATSNQHRAEQYNRNYAFSVDLDGVGPDSAEGAWNSVRGGGLRIHESQGVTTGHDQFKNHTAGICEWGDLVLTGAVTGERKAMLSWYKAMQEKGKADDCYKPVTITIKDRDGADLYAINYLECWLTAYSLCSLNGDEDSVEATEVVELCVGYSDNYL